jgi:hypothetical protein
MAKAQPAKSLPCVWVSTPGHGYLRVERKELERFHPAFRSVIAAFSSPVIYLEEDDEYLQFLAIARRARVHLAKEPLELDLVSEASPKLEKYESSTKWKRSGNTFVFEMATMLLNIQKLSESSFRGTSTLGVDFTVEYFNDARYYLAHNAFRHTVEAAYKISRLSSDAERRAALLRRARWEDGDDGTARKRVRIGHIVITIVRHASDAYAIEMGTRVLDTMIHERRRRYPTALEALEAGLAAAHTACLVDVRTYDSGRIHF